jgi:Ca2+-transporting ATPase
LEPEPNLNRFSYLVLDGPSLKIADVGISMGVGGTDVSKEAAKIILINDDLGALISGIEEGKSIFHNIRGFIRFQLSTSLAALALVSISTLFGLPNPMNAMQILYINLIMDGAPAQSLGLEPVDKDVMSKPPRPKNMPILDWSLLKLIILSAICISVGTLSGIILYL